MFIDLLFHGYEMTRNVLQWLTVSYFLTRDLMMSKKFRKDIHKVTVNKETQEKKGGYWKMTGRRGGAVLWRWRRWWALFFFFLFSEMMVLAWKSSFWDAEVGDLKFKPCSPPQRPFSFLETLTFCKGENGKGN